MLLAGIIVGVLLAMHAAHHGVQEIILQTRREAWRAGYEQGSQAESPEDYVARMEAGAAADQLIRETGGR